MLEKTVITGLIGILATVGYAEIAENAEPILQEATVVAAAMQERELHNAIELYWLQHSAYPEASDEEVVAVLHQNDLLKEDAVPFTVTYTAASDQQRYELTVS